METMSVEAFIDDHREEIDAFILVALNGRDDWVGELTDDDRIDWIANDEGLYLWAIDAGVEDV